jgi:N6-adenosine-specific RNA methylase IME4
MGRALDKIAKAVGKDRKTLAKAKAIVEAAEADPTYAPLVEKMDRTGKVDPVFRELRQRQERAANYEQRILNGCRIADLRTLAESGYRTKVIYVDVPTRHTAFSGPGLMGAAINYYDTMTVDEIKAMGPLVRSVAAKDCALFYWASGATHANALEIIKAWDFEPKTMAFVWAKTTPHAQAITLDGKGLHWGNGSYTRANVEMVLLATRGKPLRLDSGGIHQVIIAPWCGHSAKPEEVRRRIEKLYAGPYLELFGRQVVSNWTVWGNEIPKETFLEAAE